MTGSDRNRIERVVVAGGGMVGWSAAAALRRLVPGLDVTILDLPPPADAIADRITATLPSINGFHGDIGLGEANSVARAGSSFRLGTLFEQWGENRPPFVHAYGRHGQRLGSTSFHLAWVRAAHAGTAPPFDSYSVAAAMGRAGRFVHPQGAPGTPLAEFEYGLFLDPAGYSRLLRAYARHLGVTERPGRISGVRLRGEDGFISALAMDDGSTVEADLFVDCTGPAAQLRSALGGGFEDWGRWLPCDRILFADGPPAGDLPLLDRAIAMPWGWRWEAPSTAGSRHGLVYSARQLSDEAAADTLRSAARVAPGGAPISIRSGRRTQPWLRNCVAVADAAVTVEPLEWTNLHLAHSAIDRIAAMMPGRDCAPVELAEYNRQAHAEADRIRDFLALHYRFGRWDGAPWRDAAESDPPESLAHTLTLFQARGRLPFHEEETFSRESWLALLFGLGVLPRRTDPLIEMIPAAAAEGAMADMRRSLEELVPNLPPHLAYLRNLTRQAAR